MHCEKGTGLPPQDRVLRTQFRDYGIILPKLCAGDSTTMQYPTSILFARKKCLRCSSFTDQDLSLPPSTHLTDQEEGFHPVLEGASRIQRGLQLCYQSRAPGQWAWEQSGGRKQRSTFTDPTLQSQAIIRSTILAMISIALFQRVT